MHGEKRKKRQKFPSFFEAKEGIEDLKGIYKLMDFLKISHPKIVPDYKLSAKSFRKQRHNRVLPVINMYSQKKAPEELSVPSFGSYNLKVLEEKARRTKSLGVIRLDPRMSRKEPKISYQIYRMQVEERLENRENTEKLSKSVSRKKIKTRGCYDLTEGPSENQYIDIFKKEFSSRESTSKSLMKSFKTLKTPRKSRQKSRFSLIRDLEKTNELEQYTISAWEN